MRLLGEETTMHEAYNAIAWRVGTKSPWPMYAYRIVALELSDGMVGYRLGKRNGNHASRVWYWP